MNEDIFQAETSCITKGRDLAHQARIVNPPLYRASTVLFSSVEQMKEADNQWHSVPYYGRHGTPATFAFEQAMADLEGGYRAIAVSSGTAALTTAIAAFVSAGDHVLLPDSVYAPTRKFCDNFLRRFGVETTYYPPALCSTKIRSFFKPNTKVLFLESPASLTMEMQDIPAFCTAAKTAGITAIMDNTWATPLYCRSFALGVDVSVHSATKYILGHSDAMLGVITTTKETYMRVKQSAALLGHHAAPEEIYLAQRGLRTLPVRMKQQFQTALALMAWLDAQECVAAILSPTWYKDNGHALWQRDFTGGAGLFSFVLHEKYTEKHQHAFVDALKLFGLGYSWGGFESLALPVTLNGIRSTPFETRAIIRLSIGLEHLDDLQKDLHNAFTVMRHVS